MTSTFETSACRPKKHLPTIQDGQEELKRLLLRRREKEEIKGWKQPAEGLGFFISEGEMKGIGMKLEGSSLVVETLCRPLTLVWLILGCLC